MTAPTRPKEATAWTRRLQVLTAACAVVCTIGTSLWGMLMLSGGVVEDSMRLAGMSTQEAQNTAEAILPWFVLSGIVYVIGNAIGFLALRGWNWVFWQPGAHRLASAVVSTGDCSGKWHAAM